MTLRCIEVDELLGAYVLNALYADERIAVLEHIAECRLHDNEIEGLTLTATGLSALIEEREAPVALAAQTLAAFDAEAGRDAVVTEMLAPERRRSIWSGFAPFAYTLAAATVSIFAVTGLLLLGGEDGETMTAVTRSAEQGGMSLRFIYLPDEDVVVLTTQLPALDPGRTYQAWHIPSGGQPASLGVLPPNGTAAFPADLSAEATIAISVEPSGGSLQPTTTPVLTAKL